MQELFVAVVEICYLAFLYAVNSNSERFSRITDQESLAYVLYVLYDNL